MPKVKTVRRRATKLGNRAINNGAHFLLGRRNREADQEVPCTILESRSVPAEEGRLISALPAVENRDPQWHRELLARPMRAATLPTRRVPDV
jgi:hypothetical protein